MRRALAPMSDLWQPHIQTEETELSPGIMAKLLTVPEHIDLAQKAGALGQTHAQPAPLAIPFLLYNIQADDRAYYLAAMPPQVTQQLVPVAWKEEWAPMKPFLLD